MTSYVPAKKNTAFIAYVSLMDHATPGRLKANPTLAAGDVKVSIDGGAFANLATLPTVTPASGKGVKVSLSSSEMNGDNIFVVFSDQTDPPEWNDVAFNIQTAARQIDDLSYDQPVRTGTAQAGTVSSITLDAGASSVDNFYRGLCVYITGGTGAGQVGIITGYVGSTKVATTSPQWRTNPDSTSVFALMPTGGVNVEMWRTGTLNNVQSGRPDVYVGAMANDVVTAAAIATDAITSAELASSAVNEIRDAILSDSTSFAGASVAAIKAKTDNLPSDPADASDIAALFTALTSHGDSAWTTANVAAALSDWDVTFTDHKSFITSFARVLLRKDAAVAADLAGFLSFIVNADTGSGAGSYDNTTDSVQAIADAVPSAAANAAALLDAADAIETSITVRKALRGMAAILLGKVSGGQTGTEVFRAADDSKDRITSTNDAQGNRTAITMDLA